LAVVQLVHWEILVKMVAKVIKVSWDWLGLGVLLAAWDHGVPRELKVLVVQQVLMAWKEQLVCLAEMVTKVPREIQEQELVPCWTEQRARKGSKDWRQATASVDQVVL
jgi:hypothetical protein